MQTELAAHSGQGDFMAFSLFYSEHDGMVGGPSGEWARSGL
jgi:hypothetical protein